MRDQGSEVYLLVHTKSRQSCACYIAAMFVALFPGAEEGEERAPGTHCLRMRLIATEFYGDCVCTCNVRILHCKNRLVVLTGEWLPWLHGLLWYNRPIV